MRHLMILATGLALSGIGVGQDLYFSTAQALAGPFRSGHGTDIHRLQNGGLASVLPHETWRVLFGDRNGDQMLNDAPVNIDALHDLGVGFFGLLFSLDQDTTFPGQATLKDGDVFSFDAAGQPQLRHSEAEFMSWTSTTTIDVDAYCEAVDGTVYFSFADDEDTTDAGLIAQNGGSRLDEQCVLRRDPGAATAVIHFSPGQVAAFFSAALQTSVTTVVDVTGIAIDDLGAPGDLWLTSASTAQALRGRIVSSRAGGIAYASGGVTFDPASLGFDAQTRLDALHFGALLLGPTLETNSLSGSSSTGGAGRVTVSGASPGGFVQLVVTQPTAQPAATTILGSNGIGLMWNDPTDFLFWSSFAAPPWRLVADGAGIARYDFDFGGLTPLKTAVVTALDLSTQAISLPIAITIDP